MLRILLTIVASNRSGSFHLATSAAVTNAGVACASVSEDEKTAATTDDDTDEALDCLDGDNYDVIDHIYGKQNFKDHFNLRKSYKFVSCIRQSSENNHKC